MNNLSVFQFDCQEIRFVDGKPVANDVAKALGYSDPASVISKKVFEQNRSVAKMATVDGKVREVTVLEEAGIYQLIFSSKLESAQKFQQWVFNEVLPSIRQTGSYNIAEQPKPQLKSHTAIEYIEASEKLENLKDSRLQRLLRAKLEHELSLDQVNQKLLSSQETENFTTLTVLAHSLGYSSAQIGNGQQLGRYVKQFIKPDFQDYQGQYLVWHYKVTDELKEIIHEFFNPLI